MERESVAGGDGLDFVGAHFYGVDDAGAAVEIGGDAAGDGVVVAGVDNGGAALGFEVVIESAGDEVGAEGVDEEGISAEISDAAEHAGESLDAGIVDEGSAEHVFQLGVFGGSGGIEVIPEDGVGDDWAAGVGDDSAPAVGCCRGIIVAEGAVAEGGAGSVFYADGSAPVSRGEDITAEEAVDEEGLAAPDADSASPADGGVAEEAIVVHDGVGVADVDGGAGPDGAIFDEGAVGDGGAAGGDDEHSGAPICVAGIVVRMAGGDGDAIEDGGEVGGGTGDDMV